MDFLQLGAVPQQVAKGFGAVIADVILEKLQDFEVSAASFANFYNRVKALGGEVVLRKVELAER